MTVSQNSCSPRGLVTLNCERIIKPSTMMIPPATSVPRMVSTLNATPKTCQTMCSTDLDGDGDGMAGHESPGFAAGAHEALTAVCR